MAAGRWLATIPSDNAMKSNTRNCSAQYKQSVSLWDKSSPEMASQETAAEVPNCRFATKKSSNGAMKSIGLFENRAEDCLEPGTLAESEQDAQAS